MNTVTVIGSINLDRTIRVTYMPKPGETIHTKETFQLVEEKEPTKRLLLDVRRQKLTLLVVWVKTKQEKR